MPACVAVRQWREAPSPGPVRSERIATDEHNTVARRTTAYPALLAPQRVRCPADLSTHPRDRAGTDGTNWISLRPAAADDNRWLSLDVEGNPIAPVTGPGNFNLRVATASTLWGSGAMRSAYTVSRDTQSATGSPRSRCRGAGMGLRRDALGIHSLSRIGDGVR